MGSAVCLLKSPPCSGGGAGRHIESPCYSTCGCAILEELDSLCNFCRVKESPHTVSSDNDSGQNQHLWKTSQKRSRVRNLKLPPHAKPGLLIVATLVPLLLIPSTPIQLKVINNALCNLINHIIITLLHIIITSLSTNIYITYNIY